MAVDLSVFERQKSVLDQQALQEAFNLKKALATAELQKAMQPKEFDIGKVGEQAFIKASQGMPLSPTEASALQYLDAKTPTSVFNPVTGVMQEKPSLLERANVRLPQQSAQPMQKASPKFTSEQNAQLRDIFEPQDEWDAKYQAQLQAAAGNPKLQQSIRQEMAKARTTMSEAESKAAGFSERMLQSEPSIEANKDAGMSMWEKSKAAIPVVGNYAVSPEYQQFDQAQRDFINAQLRRESGAVISPEEFDNARKQYFPQSGDKPEVLAQKKANREAAINSMRTSAGAAYKPAQPVTLSTDAPQTDYKSKYGLK
jgi:ribosomal protein L29